MWSLLLLRRARQSSQIADDNPYLQPLPWFTSQQECPAQAHNLSTATSHPGNKLSVSKVNPRVPEWLSFLGWLFLQQPEPPPHRLQGKKAQQAAKSINMNLMFLVYNFILLIKWEFGLKSGNLITKAAQKTFLAFKSLAKTLHKLISEIITYAEH